MTVPAAILSAIPPSVNISELGFSVPGARVIVNATTVTRTTAPGIDVFLVGTSTGDAKATFNFQ
jgi:hypothetical protein